jgi:hypothetical protein
MNLKALVNFKLRVSCRKIRSFVVAKTCLGHWQKLRDYQCLRLPIVLRLSFTPDKGREHYPNDSQLPHPAHAKYLHPCRQRNFGKPALSLSKKRFGKAYALSLQSYLLSLRSNSVSVTNSKRRELFILCWFLCSRKCRVTFTIFHAWLIPQ